MWQTSHFSGSHTGISVNSILKLQIAEEVAILGYVFVRNLKAILLKSDFSSCAIVAARERQTYNCPKNKYINFN